MKTIIKSVVLSILIVGSTGIVKGQRSGGFDWNRVVYGGSVFPYFSNTGTLISANPFVGYKVTDRFVPGVLFSYQYASYKYTGGVTEIYNLYGVSPFARYAFMDKFFAQAEYQFLSGNYEVKPNLISKQTFSENNLLIGGGYYSPAGIFAQVMYMPTWRGVNNSVYSSPWIIRAGFSIF